MPTRIGQQGISRVEAGIERAIGQKADERRRLYSLRIRGDGKTPAQQDPSIRLHGQSGRISNERVNQRRRDIEAWIRSAVRLQAPDPVPRHAVYLLESAGDQHL